MVIMSTFRIYLYSANERIRQITEAIQQNRKNLEEQLERSRSKSKADRVRSLRLCNVITLAGRFPLARSDMQGKKCLEKKAGRIAAIC